MNHGYYRHLHIVFGNTSRIVVSSFPHVNKIIFMMQANSVSFHKIAIHYFTSTVYCRNGYVFSVVCGRGM